LRGLVLIVVLENGPSTGSSKQHDQYEQAGGDRRRRALSLSGRSTAPHNRLHRAVDLGANPARDSGAGGTENDFPYAPTMIRTL
jgi:hypothetical protein